MKNNGLKNNILAILLAGMLALAMTACSSDDDDRRGGGGGTGSSTIDISNVADGTSVGLNTIIRATASNPDAVTKVEFYVGTDTEPDPNLNTNPLYFTATAEPYQFNLYTGGGTFSHGDTIMIRAKVYCTNGGTNYDIVASLVVDNMLPSIDITTPAAFDTINSIAATITASAYDDSDTGVDVDRVELYVDEQIIDTVSSGTGTGPYTYEITDWDTTTLSHGNHTVKAVVYDAGGNSASDEVTVVIDNGNPAVEITSPASAAVVNGNTVIIKVNASDNDGIAQIALSIDGPSTGSPDDITDTDNGVPFQFTWDLTDKTDGDHEITVTATDDIGNFSSDTITVTVDRTAPTVNVTAPLNGATVHGSAVAVTATAADTNLSGVKFYIDGALKSTDTASPYSWIWNTTGYEDGGHSVRAAAYDAGGLTTSSTVNVTVDNEGPYNVKLVSPQADETVSGTVTLGATAQDYAGSVDHVEFWLDGTTDLGDGAFNVDAYELAWNSASVADGEHGMEIRAYDDAGNATINDTATFWVDNTDPATVSITSPAASADVSGTVNIEITASDSGIGIDYIEISAGSATGNCYHLGGTSYEYQWDTTPNADGTYTVTATAYDLLGGTSVDTVSVDVDNTPPSAVNVTSPINGAYVTGTIAINASATGASSVEFYIDGSLAATDGTSPYSYSWATTTNGEHSIRIIAYDAAGNTTIDNDTTVIVDNTAPTVTISNPAGSSYLKGTVNISAVASDNSAIDRVVFNIGGGAITQTDTTSPYEYSWNTTTPGNGSVTITATVYDEAGSSDVDSITVTVDNTAPNSSAVAISPITTPNFLNDNDLRDDVTVQATASDGQTGIAKVRFSINEVSGTHDVEYTDLSSPYEYTWNTTLATFPNGEYTITITSYDYAGNTTTTTTGDTAVSVDNTDPAPGTLTIVDNDGLTDTGDFITYASVNLTSSATDNVNVYQMRFSNDNATWYAWEAYNTTRPSAWDMTSATYGGTNTDGTKTVYVQYRDNAGNNVSTSDTIFLDRVNPTADAGTALLYFNTATALNGTSIDDTNGADDSGVESRLWTDLGTGTGSGTVTFSNAAIDDPTFQATAEGTYNLQFWVRDNAGRTATDTATIHWDVTPPTANAGADRLRGPNTTNTISDSSSSDGGTNPSGVASVLWSRTGGTGTGTPNFSNASVTNPTFTVTGATPDGTYILNFAVTDNATNSSNDSMTVTWDQTVPTVSITSPATGTYHNSAITLTANTSDTHAMTYQWTASGPGTVTFGDDTAEDTTCSMSTDGTYTLTLTVTDAALNTNSASVTVYRDTTPPNVDAGTYSTAGASFTLSPTVSDGMGVGVDTSSYSWTVTASPAGSTEHGMPSTSLTPTVWMDVDGSYTLQLAASDLLSNGPSSDTATITWDRSITDGTLTNYGQYSSLATVNDGTNDRVFISYYDAANSDLRMACLNGNATASPSVLATVGVDGAAGYGTNATTNDVGMYNDIEVILDGTTYYAYIVYYDNTASAVKMARGTSTNLTTWTWTVYTIDAAVGAYAGSGSLSIAAIDMGADHQAYVSYYDATNGYLMSGRSGSTDWTYWITATIDSTNDVGRFSSNDIYTVSGDIRSGIIYCDETAGNLKYAIAPQASSTITCNDTLWTPDFQGDYFIIYDGAISYGIWISYNGNPSSAPAMGTDYAYEVSAVTLDYDQGVANKIATVLNSITGTPFNATSTPGGTGTDSTIAVTHNNAGLAGPASESFDSLSGVSTTNPAWNMPAAITTETAGADGHSSLVLNNSGGTAYAFISYYNATDGYWYLTHGPATGASWTSDQIETATNTAVNERSSLYIYWDGSAYDGFISYWDYSGTNGYLKFASSTGAGAAAWSAFTALTIDAGATVGLYNSIGGYYTGSVYRLFIGYFDDGDDEVKFARSLDGGASW